MVTKRNRRGLGSVRWRQDRPDGFEIDFRVGGRRFREKIHVSSEREAWAELHRRFADESARASAPTHTTAAPSISVEHAIDLWAKAESKPGHIAARCRWFAEWYGPRKMLSSVTPRVIRAYIAALPKLRGVGPTTVNRYVTTISGFMRWAVQHELAESNPVRGVPRPMESPESPEPLTDAQIAAMLEATSGHPMLEPAYHLVLYAAMRRAEAASAMWEDVDLEGRRIFVRGTKTPRSRGWVPLLGPLEQWLQANHRKSGPILMKRRGGAGVPRPQSLQRSREALNRRLGSDVAPPFHQCRHTCAHRLIVKQGAPIHWVASFIRDTIKMVEDVYGHYGATDFADPYRDVDF